MKKYSLEFTDVRDLMRKAKAIEQAHIEQANENEKMLIENEIDHIRLPYGILMDVKNLSAKEQKIVFNGISTSIVNQSYEDNGVKITE